MAISPRSWYRARLFPRTLRSRLRLLAAVAVLPGLCFALVYSVQEAREESNRGQALSAQLAAALEMRQGEERTRAAHFLEMIPMLAVGAEPDSFCSQVGPGLWSAAPPGYDNLGVATETGVVACSRSPLGEPLEEFYPNLHEAILLASGSREPVVGRVGEDPESKSALLPLAMQMARPDGGVFFLLMGFSWLDDFVAEMPQAGGTTVAVLDRDGRVLESHGGASVSLGAGSFGGGRRSVVVEVRDMTGAAVGQLRATMGPVGWWESQGEVFFVLGGLIGLSILAAFQVWVMGRRHIWQPVAQMVSVLDRVATGRFDARVELPEAEGELGRLSRAMGQTVKALEVRNMERTAREEFIKSVVESTRDGILAYDRQMRYTIWNRAMEQLTHVDREEVLGRPDGEVLGFLSGPEETRKVQAVLAGRPSPSSEISYRAPGTERSVWCEVRHAPLLGPDGTISGGIAVVRDITEWKLVRKNLRYQAQILENLGEGVIAGDIEGRIAYMNRTAERLVGRSLEESRGRSALDLLVPSESLAAVRRRVEEAVESGVGWEGEITLSRRGHGAFPVWVHFTVLRDEAGRVTARVGIIRDLTEQKEAEARLQESQIRLATIVGHVPVILTSLDSKGVLAVVGGAVLGGAVLGGMQPEGVEDQGLMLERRGFLSLRTGEGSTVEAEELKRRVLSGEDVEGLSRVDGRVYDSRFVPVRDEDGTVKGAVGVALEVTDRVKAESALRASEERFRRAFEAGPLGIALVDKDHRIRQANSRLANLLGYEVDELCRLTVEEITFPEDTLETRSIVDSLLAEGEPDWVQVNKRYRTRTGSTRWATTTASLVTLPEGGSYVMGMVEDITEKYHAEQRLRQSREKLRRLAGRLIEAREEERVVVAREIHDELGQSLTALRMDVGRLRHRLINGKEIKRETIDHMEDVIEGTLGTVHRVATWLRPGILDDLGLGAALEHLAEEFEQRTGVACIVECDPLNGGVRPTEVALFRICQEALTNVARHAKATHVRIDVERDESLLILTVRDDGEGFDHLGAEASERLGILGMSERARALGGMLKVESTRGEGTEIRATIPLREEGLP